MSRCVFLIDECLPASVNRGLLRRLVDADVLRVGEEFCQQTQRLLVTADRATMPDEIRRHLDAGDSTWGVLIVRPKSSLSRVLDDLELVAQSSEAEEWMDNFACIPF